MTVLVTGGRGVFGSLLTSSLRARGSEVVISSRRNTPGVRHLDLTRGSVDPSLFDGISTLVHAATNPARPNTVDVSGTERLLEAARRADLQHFVYLSIVGVDDHPFPYYKAKQRAEQLIESSPVPSTIIRATQFHEFLARIFDTGPVIVRFSGFEFQVIDGATVAARVAAITEAEPMGRVADIGGPESVTMQHMAESWKRVRGSRKPIVTVPLRGKIASSFRERRHFTPNRVEDSPTWDEWLRSHLQAET